VTLITLNVGVDDSSPPPSLHDNDPIWYKKTTTWLTTFRKACPMKIGMGGQYCSWRGSPCCYELCPARVFEEVELKDVSYMTGAAPTNDLASLRT